MKSILRLDSWFKLTHLIRYGQLSLSSTSNHSSSSSCFVSHFVLSTIVFTSSAYIVSKHCNLFSLLVIHFTPSLKRCLFQSEKFNKNCLIKMHEPHQTLQIKKFSLIIPICLPKPILPNTGQHSTGDDRKRLRKPNLHNPTQNGGHGPGYSCVELGFGFGVLVGLSPEIFPSA